MENKTYQKVATLLAVITSTIAGLLHITVVAFEHVAPLPLETVFFIVGGIAQVVFPLLFYRTGRMKYAIATFVVNGGIAALWVLVRVFKAPFMSSPESVGTMGLVVTGLQLISMAAIGAWKWFKKHRIKDIHGYSYIAVVLGAMVLSFVLGTSVYAAGRLGEVMMPERQIEHNHGHGSSGGHGHNQENHPNNKEEENHSTKEKNEEPKTKEEKNNKKTETSSDKSEHQHGHSGHH